MHVDIYMVKNSIGTFLTDGMKMRGVKNANGSPKQREQRKNVVGFFFCYIYSVDKVIVIPHFLG